MKNIRNTIIGIIIFLIIGGTVTLIYRYEKNKVRRELALRIAELSPRGGIPETVDQLRKAIAIYEDQIERNVQEGAQTGVYWKILAMRLSDRNMHRDALEALERALHFNTADPVLMFLTGESASIVAANAMQFSISGPNEREHYYKLSETAYLRAIELDRSYTRPLLGLGILYTFDLNRPAEAIPYLVNYLNMNSADIRGMFVLARSYFMTARYAEAIELYDRILSRSKDPNIRAEAENNREITRSLM